MGDQADNSITMPDLGNNFFLGATYNARRNEKCGGSLLLHEPGADDVVHAVCPLTDFSLEQDDTFSKRRDDLGLSASVSMSVMGGALDLTGACRYARDGVRSTTTARVTFVWRSNVRTERLKGRVKSLDHFHPSVVGQDGPVRVVVVVVAPQRVRARVNTLRCARWLLACADSLCDTRQVWCPCAHGV